MLETVMINGLMSNTIFFEELQFYIYEVRNE